MRVDISRDDRATHYCKHCGLTMKARDQFFCRDRDGDFCEPCKVLPLADLNIGHPRVIRARIHWQEHGCRHRPKCVSFIQHKRAST